MKKKLDRIKNDFYETPAKLTEELLSRFDFSGSFIFEPCAGDRAIAKVLAQTYGEDWIIDTDITDNLSTSFRTYLDATSNLYWEENKGLITSTKRSIITNPPFNLAHKILPLALDFATDKVAVLLRATYTEPCRNRDRWLINNSDRMIARIDINPRPRFRTDTGNTDLTSVSWLVWDKNFSWQKTMGIKSPFQFITNWR